MSCYILGMLLLGGHVGRCDDSPTEVEMAGYLLVPHQEAPETYNAGFSMYVTAWPLLNHYPGNRFQTGLFGTWMFAQYDGATPDRKLYSDIEGGLGWWRDTRFATETPKFIMGGVALNFSEWANGPGAGKGRDWDQPKGKYGIAQLSSSVLWPPDGLNLKQGTCNELVGYGYLPLPLSTHKSTTAGKQVPTGDRCWTLFLNTGNFKGPVAFFTPYFWSAATADDPTLSGLFLDSRPSKPNKALQMETQYIPAFQATDSNGVTYARVAPTSFPRDASGDSLVVHRMLVYNKNALWDAVKTWFDGGPAANGKIDESASAPQTFMSKGGSTWRIYPRSATKEQRVKIAWDAFASPVELDSVSYGYRWNYELATKTESEHGQLVTLPEYYRLDGVETDKPIWVPVPSAEVPVETGLANVQFHRPNDKRANHKMAEPYVTPDDPLSCWKKPGPAAGPFQAKLGDGSVVTYYWYRFADQPALLNADLTEVEREAMQLKVEKLHRTWTKDREYLAPPTLGTLADLDPALLVTPPKGLEIGYVPIATRQEEQTR
ncbi:hypothetical protein [Novipirellula herctigrandis]|uniref:hypothetical protein n=1 Tax=Novipirellula herctigrandis TaxID=2527986 RepID=UPI003AF36E13